VLSFVPTPFRAGVRPLPHSLCLCLYCTVDEFVILAGEKGRVRVWNIDVLKEVLSFDVSVSTSPSSPSESDSDRQVFSEDTFGLSHLVLWDAGVVRRTGRAEVVVATAQHNLHFFDLHRVWAHLLCASRRGATTKKIARSKLLVGFNDEIIDVRAFPDSIHAAVRTSLLQSDFFTMYAR